MTLPNAGAGRGVRSAVVADNAEEGSAPVQGAPEPDRESGGDSASGRLGLLLVVSVCFFGPSLIALAAAALTRREWVFPLVLFVVIWVVLVAGWTGLLRLVARGDSVTESETGQWLVVSSFLATVGAWASIPVLVVSTIVLIVRAT